jgi:hypothetical protein
MPKTEQEKLRMIKEVDATMRISNMPLTDEDKKRLKDIADGKITVDEAIAEITKKHKKGA